MGTRDPNTLGHHRRIHQRIWGNPHGRPCFTWLKNITDQ